MTFLEKITNPTVPMHWLGNMQADYRYTHGVAGEKFFQHLKTNDSFLATKCPSCSRVYIPPRLFCEHCFDEIGEDGWQEVPAEGIVRLYTISRVDTHGEELAEPRVMALIDILETHGSLLGVLDVDPDDACIGMPVKAKLRPKAERAGNMNDILGFEPFQE